MKQSQCLDINITLNVKLYGFMLQYSVGIQRSMRMDLITIVPKFVHNNNNNTNTNHCKYILFANN